jgi:predicted anti-sigma-YlaC factor YlaD
VGCEEYREALSARLDGEDEPIPAADTDGHLRRCAACRQRLHDATAVTRMVRLQPVAATPRVDVAVVVSAVRPRGRRLAGVLRVALGALGAAQFVLGMLQIARNSAVDHDHNTIVAAGATPGHLWHESAAWNVAVGAGFAWSAWRRTRPTGTLPMLTAFVGLLVLLSANDVFAGRVEQIRLLSHGFLLAGYAIVLALCHPRLDPGRPPRQGQRGHRWRRRVLDLDATEPAPPSLRLIQGQARTRFSDRRAA